MMTWGNANEPHNNNHATHTATTVKLEPRAPPAPHAAERHSHTESSASPDLRHSESGSDSLFSPDLNAHPHHLQDHSGLPAHSPQHSFGLPGQGQGQAAGGAADPTSAQASFPFIFPSWALDAGEQIDFVSMLNPVMDGTGTGQPSPEGGLYA